MGVEIKRVMEKDDKGVDRQIFPITHINAIEGIEELSDDSYEEGTVASDFKGKIVGSNAGNPNNVKYTYQTSIFQPSQFTAELVNGANNAFNAYESLMELDGSTIRLSNTANGYIAQSLISWNILEIVTRRYPELKGVSIVKLRTLVTGITMRVYAKGNGPTGNKVTFGQWNKSSNSWVIASTNPTADVKELVGTFASPVQMNNGIDDKGVAHNIIYADPANGTIASNLSVDYADIEITLKIPLTQKIPTMKQYIELLERVETLENK